MAWLVLVLGGIFEAAWAVGLKYVDGFQRPWILLGVGLAMGASLLCLTYALKSLPVGVAYAGWTSIGVAVAALLGAYLFGETLTPLRLLGLGLILAGVASLRLSA